MMVPSKLIFTCARARNYVLHNFGVLRLFLYSIHWVKLRGLFVFLEYLFKFFCLYFLARYVFRHTLPFSSNGSCQMSMWKTRFWHDFRFFLCSRKKIMWHYSTIRDNSRQWKHVIGCCAPFTFGRLAWLQQQLGW